MYQLKKSLLQLIIYFTLFLISMSPHAQQKNQNPFEVNSITYYPQWYLGGYVFKNGPRSAGESTLLSPLFTTSDQLLFASMRLLDKSSTPWEGSLALGYRYLNPNHTNLIGLYGGIDHLKTTTRDSFNQINVGIEAWQHDWFLGANMYCPYGRHQYAVPNLPTVSFHRNGGYRNIGFTETTESVLPGADAEIGRTLMGNLTVYGGGYYFHEADIKTLAGPKVRAEYVFYAEPNHKILGLFDRVAVEGVVTDDAVRGINYYGGLTIGMSWGNSNANLNLKGVERHMVDRIRRDVDVIAQSNTQNVNLPVNIRDVDTLNDFNQALADNKADVIAVHGQIKGVSDAMINRSLYLTGNTYQFVRDKKFINITVAQGGGLIGKSINNSGDHGLLKIKEEKSNITIRDLNLSVDKTAPLAIFHSSEDGSMGTLTLERILTNGNLKIEVSGKDNTATIDHIADSIFNINSGSALSFSANNGGQIKIGEISDNMIETQSAHSSGMFFSTSHANMTIKNISMNSISTNDKKSPGLDFLVAGGTMWVENIKENSIDTSSIGMHFDANLFGNLSVSKISGNEIKVTGINLVNKLTCTATGIDFLSKPDATISIGNIINNAIAIDMNNVNNNLSVGINIISDGGNIFGKKINSNQIILENSSENSRGLFLGQRNANHSSFIKLDSIAFNQVKLIGGNGDGFGLFAVSPADGISVHLFSENIITRDDF